MANSHSLVRIDKMAFRLHEISFTKLKLRKQPSHLEIFYLSHSPIGGSIGALPQFHYLLSTQAASQRDL